MNWSSLLPSTVNPAVAFERLFGADRDLATHALRDVFILLNLGVGTLFGLIVLYQTVGSWRKLTPYFRETKGGESAVASVLASSLPLFRELRHHLIEFTFRDGTGRTSKRRTVDAEEVFREEALAPAFTSNRLVLAIPSILTGLGVLGTFVGLQLGIGSLNLKDPGNLDKSIVPLIEGCAVAFSSSVWGVLASLLFSGWEKFFEGLALWRVRRIQNKVNALFPSYVPEDAMSELERSSRGTEDLLKGLAVAIGAEMQQAIGRLGAEIKDAVSNATAEGHAPLMERSAELLSSALTAELSHLKEQIEAMGTRFAEGFNGASNGLLKSVQDFQPVVVELSGMVGDARTTVASAVSKLNAHEAVAEKMTEAAANIRAAAEIFGAMNETLALSSARNEEAATAQLTAAQTNEQVAHEFARVSETLPAVNEMLSAAASVIGSLGAPLVELRTLLEQQPELQRQHETTRATSESERSQVLLSMAGNLAEKVGQAAQQFAEIGALADKLSTSAESLDSASNELAVFGQQVIEASKQQRDAAEASRAAAASGERAAKAFEPLPGTINALTGGLAAAGNSVRGGAESAREAYETLIEFQQQWFAGAELGLNAMKDRLQTLLQSYGDQVEGQTRNLMGQWTKTVAECLQSYESQVATLQGDLDELLGAIQRNEPAALRWPLCSAAGKRRGSPSKGKIPSC